MSLKNACLCRSEYPAHRSGGGEGLHGLFARTSSRCHSSCGRRALRIETSASDEKRKATRPVSIAKFFVSIALSYSCAAKAVHHRRHPMTQSRRHHLIALASFGALGLPGCGTLRTAPEPTFTLPMS